MPRVPRACVAQRGDERGVAALAEALAQRGECGGEEDRHASRQQPAARAQQLGLIRRLVILHLCEGAGAWGGAAHASLPRKGTAGLSRASLARTAPARLELVRPVRGRHERTQRLGAADAPNRPAGGAGDLGGRLSGGWREVVSGGRGE